MDSLRGKYRISRGGLDVDAGGNSAVLTPTFVAESLRRKEPRDDGLGAFRGAVNGALITLVFWIALGLAIFTFS